MNKRSIARLIGVIRLVDHVDTIGVPVFATPSANHMLIPETDTDFRILRFQDFYNSNGYYITYDIEKPFRYKEYSIGEYSPVPFWFMGKCVAVEGDTEPSTLSWNSNSSPIVNEVARILREAKQGKYEERRKEWQSADIEQRFEDVFFEVPSHSRYWISRYRVALAVARKEAEPPHPIDKSLRTASQRWLQKFATKTDVNRLLAILGEPKDGIFSKARIKDVLFAYLVHKRLGSGSASVEQMADQPWFSHNFPGGLYSHYIDNGWPRVPFAYQRPRDILSSMRKAFSEGVETGNLKQAILLSRTLFGIEDVPKQLEDFMYDQYSRFRRKMDEQIRSSNLIFRDRGFKHNWASTARDIVISYTMIRGIDAIMNGGSRTCELPPEHYGIEPAYLEMLLDMQVNDND